MRIGSLRYLVLPVVVAGALVAAKSGGSATKSIDTACGRASAPASMTLSVVGDQMQDSSGNTIVPYGVSLVGGPETRWWRIAERSASAQITASHDYWHANTVRVQVGEALLLANPTPGHTYNVGVADSANRLICQILRQHQIPVINDTTLFTARSRGPTAQSVAFWKFMAQRYRNLPVIFDVFDEPRLGRNPRTNHYIRMAQVWRTWQRGGSIAGKKYVGMQALIDTIRRRHINNVIWAEEPWYLDPEKLPTRELPAHLLRGGNIVYAFHKAQLRTGSRSLRALQAVALKGIPLVDSEWSQFAATNRPWECQDDADRGVPRFLTALRDGPIGLLAWSLQPGALVKGTAGVDTVHDGNDWRFASNPGELAVPNTMKSTYKCDTASLGQGAGKLVQDYFTRYSQDPSAALFPKFG
jgi:hypothetical protein